MFGPKMYPGLIYGIICAVCVSVNLSSPTLSIQIGTGFVALISGVMSAATIGMWIADRGADVYERMRVAATQTPSSTLANAMRGQPEYVARIVKSQGELATGTMEVQGGPREYVYGTTV